MFKIIDNRNTSQLIRRWDTVIVVTICLLAFGQLLPAASAGEKFHLEEATIADIHRAIGGKQTSCTKFSNSKFGFSQYQQAQSLAVRP